MEKAYTNTNITLTFEPTWKTRNNLNAPSGDAPIPHSTIEEDAARKRKRAQEADASSTTMWRRAPLALLDTNIHLSQQPEQQADDFETGPEGDKPATKRQRQHKVRTTRKNRVIADLAKDAAGLSFTPISI